MNGVILAGGRATRLGPLAASMNKSLVSIGSKPMLVRQVQQLRRAGCLQVVVVVARSQVEQVRDVVSRAGLPDVDVEVQDEPRGPAHALFYGLLALHDEEQPVTVLMADTFIEDEDLPRDVGAVCVAPAPTTRSWCGWNGSQWCDAVFVEGQSVAVGAYQLDAPSAILAYKAVEEFTGELGMAEFLNTYGRTIAQVATTWRDLGDLGALARARREHNITRSFNELRVDAGGLVTKVTPNRAEVRFVRDVVRRQQHDGRPLGTLYPTVYGGTNDSYTLEHVDLPTLAELWLYWPGGAQVWTHIVKTLLDRMHAFHWHVLPNGARASHFDFEAQVWQRWKSWDHPIQREDPLVINGREFQAGNILVNRLVHDLRDVVWTPARAHGDLNFTNVLWSLGTSNFKLLDPRGDVWFREYDLAKLRYSYRGGFPAITHGLFDVAGGADTWDLHLWPQRDVECDALDKLVGDLHGLDALLMINGAALHEGDERLALYLRGVELANEPTR